MESFSCDRTRPLPKIESNPSGPQRPGGGTAREVVEMRPTAAVRRPESKPSRGDAPSSLEGPRPSVLARSSRPPHFGSHSPAPKKIHVPVLVLAAGQMAPDARRDAASTASAARVHVVARKEPEAAGAPDPNRAPFLDSKHERIGAGLPRQRGSVAAAPLGMPQLRAEVAEVLRRGGRSMHLV